MALAVAPFLASCETDTDDNPTLREPAGNLTLTAPAGAETTYDLLNDTENRVRLVIDRDALAHEFFGCHPCRNTSSLRIATADLTGKILPALHHEPAYVSL